MPQKLILLLQGKKIIKEIMIKIRRVIESLLERGKKAFLNIENHLKNEHFYFKKPSIAW
jgi:hypothetical protein